MVKQGGLLESVIAKQSSDGLCETCNAFITMSETSYGCTVKDKLIMPEYIPYSNPKFKCKDWKRSDK